MAIKKTIKNKRKNTKKQRRTQAKTQKRKQLFSKLKGGNTFIIGNLYTISVQGYDKYKNNGDYYYLGENDEHSIFLKYGSEIKFLYNRNEGIMRKTFSVITFYLYDECVEKGNSGNAFFRLKDACKGFLNLFNINNSNNSLNLYDLVNYKKIETDSKDKRYVLKTPNDLKIVYKTTDNDTVDKYYIKESCNSLTNIFRQNCNDIEITIQEKNSNNSTNNNTEFVTSNNNSVYNAFPSRSSYSNQVSDNTIQGSDNTTPVSDNPTY